MEKKIFGTDGIRGKVNQYPITYQFFNRFAFALVEFLNKKSKIKIVLANDTRRSSDMIEASLASVFYSLGVDCVFLGSVPTPSVSYITKKIKADFGIMISASHNLFHDNGIKVFKKNGEKLSDREEILLEKKIEKISNLNLSDSKDIGKKIDYKKPLDDYKEIINGIISKNTDLSGLRVVLDCANGAASEFAPKIFTDYGVKILTESNSPNGQNINKFCGATYPDKIIKSVLKQKADIGFALDGDSDRLIMCDANGRLIDGDQILAITAISMLKQNKLKGNAVVSTKMSNLGLRDYLKSFSLNLFRSDVGDKNVIEMMKLKRCNLGGEQSGHIIFSDFSSTGDAILSALQILTILKGQNYRPDRLLEKFIRYPQKLVNLKLESNISLILKNQKLKELITLIKKSLIDDGSLLIRKSGTENLLRIMVQSKSNSKVKKIINELKTCIIDIDKKK